MNLDFMAVIKELGGGLAAVVIVVEAWVIYLLYTKNERLVEKLLSSTEAGADRTREMHEKTLTAVSALTSATQANNATAQAAVSLMERERGR